MDIVIKPIRFNDRLSQQEIEHIFGLEDTDWCSMETDPTWWQLRIVILCWWGGSLEPFVNIFRRRNES